MTADFDVIGARDVAAGPGQPARGVWFAGNSPVIADLELKRCGFRFAASPVVLATTCRDGTNCLIPRVFKLCAYAMDFPVEQMMEMTGRELCERTFSSDACRQILMTPVAFWEHGAPLARGQGAFGTTFALYYTTGVGSGPVRALWCRAATDGRSARGT